MEGSTMKKRYLAAMLLASTCAGLLPGCVFVTADFRHTKNVILRELGPADVDTEFQLRIGRGLLSFGGLVAGFADVDDEALSYLKDVKTVQVGVYNLLGTRDRPLTIPAKIGKKLASKGYEPMVRVKERDEAVWVMTELHGERLRSLYVIALDREQLVLVEVRGRLERLVEKAIEDHGFRHGDFLDM
jgi:hypothetical protein